MSLRDSIEIKDKPLFKTGDVCLFQIPGFEDEPDSIKEIMVIAGEPYLYKGTGTITDWYYPIEGKANDCPQGLLKLR